VRFFFFFLILKLFFECVSVCVSACLTHPSSRDSTTSKENRKPSAIQLR
jgi:hypothetical protein